MTIDLPLHLRISLSIRHSIAVCELLIALLTRLSSTKMKTAS
jgi:hypothetical protein